MFLFIVKVLDVRELLTKLDPISEEFHIQKWIFLTSSEEHLKEFSELANTQKMLPKP